MTDTPEPLSDAEIREWIERANGAKNTNWYITHDRAIALGEALLAAREELEQAKREAAKWHELYLTADAEHHSCHDEAAHTQRERAEAAELEAANGRAAREELEQAKIRHQRLVALSVEMAAELGGQSMERLEAVAGKTVRLQERAEAAEADCAALREAIREFDEFHNAPTSSRPSLWFRDVLAQPNPGAGVLERLRQCEGLLNEALHFIDGDYAELDLDDRIRAALGAGRGGTIVTEDYTDFPLGREAVLCEVSAERDRQERLLVERNWKWSMATPGIEPALKLMPLMEEVGEVAHAVRRQEGFAVAGNSHDNHGLRTELIQVAACAVAWVEAIDAEAQAGGQEQAT